MNNHNWMSLQNSRKENRFNRNSTYRRFHKDIDDSKWGTEVWYLWWCRASPLVKVRSCVMKLQISLIMRLQILSVDTYQSTQTIRLILKRGEGGLQIVREPIFLFFLKSNEIYTVKIYEEVVKHCIRNLSCKTIPCFRKSTRLLLWDRIKSKHSSSR